MHHDESQSISGLSFEHLSLVYPDGTKAIQDLSLTVAPEEFVSVVGPSGCGKSSLLRVAAALESPSVGLCRVDPSGIGYVFQDATLLPWRNVRRNVQLFGELHGFSPARLHDASASAIDLVGLAGSEEKFPHQLSGGMRMRASLARSLVLDPVLFLFDEPFGALDEITRERLNDEVLRLFIERGFAALFVTHSIAEAVYMSSRVVVMSERPGTVLGEVVVPFSYPRSHELRYETEFGRVCAEVSALLGGGTRG